MKKAIKEILTLLLCVAAWTYAADSFEVKLTTSDTNGSLAFYDDGGCSFEELKQSFRTNTGECSKGAVIKVRAYSEYGALLKLKCWQSSKGCVSTDNILEIKVSSDTVLQAKYEESIADMFMHVSDYSGLFMFPVFGKDTFKIENQLLFGAQNYVYMVFQYNSGKGYKNMMNPVKISKNEGLPKELSTIVFSRDFSTEINANGEVRKHSFKKDSLSFYLSLSFS